jgi:hypothetical protein
MESNREDQTLREYIPFSGEVQTGSGQLTTGIGRVDVRIAAESRGILPGNAGGNNLPILHYVLRSEALKGLVRFRERSRHAPFAVADGTRRGCDFFDFP